MKKVYVIEDFCIGCGTCMVYCAAAHSEYPKDLLKAFKLSSLKPVPRLFIEEEEGNSYSLMCRHCDEPLCVYSCISGAMFKDNRTGVVKVDKERCVGCFTCVIACPYGFIREGSENGRSLPLKCDLCKDSFDMPQCVEHCPNEALRYGEE
ncbi:4Fe-4S dicluster domain-containing protein [Thermosyntropha sp.]|uniref:4Fe-4S dicluster domain-containing protein n=1 Tax=Thermosyntropha sp. TaxID=2740820 RepID=UPI0025CF8399|nr:4Fe-4S dicluster domain-containing protein [Thermosyntropha sp.]MBO8159107.1 4Fe-4S dicluster domain-containing protein [Thermosyntropha sp.]